jgi:predicted nucleic acid-binding protein
VGGNDSKELKPSTADFDWIFETTVLSAFALANRLDIVRELYSGRATWTLVVHDELMQGVKEEPRLGDAVAADWLGEPQPVFDTARVENLRQRLGGRPHDDRHHGEATCIALAEQIGAGILLDDRDAKRLAEASEIPTGTTLSVLTVAVREGQVSADGASELLSDLIDRHGRRLPRLPAEQFSRR